MLRPSRYNAVYAPLPMFHVTGRTPTVTMADVGGRVVLRERLSIGEFWRDILEHNCTSTTAASAALLLAAPPRDSARARARMTQASLDATVP